LSIAGGDLNDPAFRAVYLAADPRAAGYVIHSLRGHLEKSSDVTIPVAWALGL
jgi:hypothetical protein